MRVSLGSSLVIAGVSVPLLVAAVVFAQAKPVAAPAPVPPPTVAGPAAPSVSPASVSPASVAAASPTAPVDAPPPDSFDLAGALRGTGPSMTPDEIAARAVRTAPSLAKAEAASNKARVAAEQAYIAVYPRLEVVGRYTRLSEATPIALSRAVNIPVNDAAGNPLGKFTFPAIKFPSPILDQFLAEATLAYPVSQLFFSIMPRYRAAKQAIEAQKYQAKAEAQLVGMRARETYWNYARTRAALMVARATLAQTQAHRHDVDALVNAGTLARVELMRADAQIAAATGDIARKQASVSVARTALFSLTHMEGTDDLTIGEDLEQPLPALQDTNDALIAQALERRSEIKALRVLAGVHEQTIDGQRGDKLPKFAVGGLADVADPNQRYGGFTHGVRTNWAAYAQISWSPNDFMVANKAEDQTRADLAQTLADLEGLEDQLRVEVSQAYEDYNAARAGLEAAHSGITAAEESFRVRREQFRAGAAVATDVIDSEKDLSQARLELVNAVIGMRVAKVHLDRATESE